MTSDGSKQVRDNNRVQYRTRHLLDTHNDKGGIASSGFDTIDHDEDRYTSNTHGTATGAGAG